MASVFSQSFEYLEYILIDGASTDGSKDYISTHADRLSYWVSEPDAGVYQAMNKGIKAARGTYVLFLNSGDEFTTSNVLQEAMDASNFSADIIYGDYEFENGRKTYPDTVTPYFLFKSSLPHQSTFFKRTIFDRMGYYNETYKITSDREFYLKCVLEGTIQFEHIPLAVARFDRKGMSNDATFQELKRKENEQMLRFHLGACYDDYVRFREMEHALNKHQRNQWQWYLNRFRKKWNTLWNSRS